MTVKQRKKEAKQEKQKGSSSKKKRKESDQLWKIVLAFVIIIALATAAIYLVGGNKSLKEKTAEETVKEEAEKTQSKKGKVVKKKPKDPHSSITNKYNKTMEKEDIEKTQSKKEKIVKKKPEDPHSPITNKYDKTIAKQLKNGEKILESRDFERARKTFEKLVKDHPESPRAMYGLARSLDELAEVKRSNDLLQQAINTLGKVGKVKNCPLPLRRLAVFRQAERLAFFGRSHTALGVLEELSKSLPHDIEVWNKIGVQALLSGNNNHAKKAFQEALNINPKDGYALVHLGFVVKSESNYKDAIPFLKEGIETGEPGTDDSRFFFHLGDAYYRLGKAKEAYEVYNQGAKRGHFLSKMQRSLYNADTPLRAKPFWTPNETPYVNQIRFLEKNWKVIRDEGVALYDAKKGAFVPEDEGLREKGDWQQFTMFHQGRKDRAACVKAPQTCKLVENIPEAAYCKRGQVKFSVMKPGTHVWAHCGPTNCRIRGHLGLVIPKDVAIRVNSTTNTWEEGKMIIIDDSIEHEVWHNGTTFRMILIVDFWHPDLTQRQKDTMSPI